MYYFKVTSNNRELEVLQYQRQCGIFVEVLVSYIDISYFKYGRTFYLHEQCIIGKH